MFAARRQKLLEAMGPDAVALVVGARPATRSNDTEYPFRQDSDFWYLTGFDHPNAVAVLRTDGGPEFTLFVEPRDPDMPRPGPATDRASRAPLRDYGADRAFPLASSRRRTSGNRRQGRRVYHSLGRSARRSMRN